jgi:predicted HicB family RNase H-like nuclease
METPTPPPDDPALEIKDASIGIRTTKKLKAAAEAAARAERRSTSQWVEGLIIDALEARSRKGD